MSDDFQDIHLTNYERVKLHHEMELLGVIFGCYVRVGIIQGHHQDTRRLRGSSNCSICPYSIRRLPRGPT